MSHNVASYLFFGLSSTCFFKCTRKRNFCETYFSLRIIRFSGCFFLAPPICWFVFNCGNVPSKVSPRRQELLIFYCNLLPCSIDLEVTCFCVFLTQLHRKKKICLPCLHVSPYFFQINTHFICKPFFSP